MVTTSHSLERLLLKQKKSKRRKRGSEGGGAGVPCVETLEPFYMADRDVKEYNHCGKQYGIWSTFDPVIPALLIRPSASTAETGRYLYTCVNRQNVDAIQVFIDGWLGNQYIVNTHHGILFSL